MDENISNLGVAKLRGLGDAIIGLSTLSYLQKTQKFSQLHYFVPQWVTPLFIPLRGPWAQIHGIHLQNWNGWLKSWSSLRSLKIQALLELNQTGRGSKFFKLSMMGRGPYFAHNHQPNSPRVVHDQGVIKPNIQRDLDGAWSFLKSLRLGDDLKTPANFLECSPQVQLVNPVQKKQVVILGMIAQRETKLWPIPLVANFCKLFFEKFPEWQLWAPVSGSHVDQNLKKQLQSLVRDERLKIIEVPLSELAISVAQGVAYVGNDTGLKHLALALGLRTLTLFGGEDPMEWHPYDPIQHPFFYQPGLECRTRTGHFCGLMTCDSMICLNQFPPTSVLEKLVPLIS